MKQLKTELTTKSYEGQVESSTLGGGRLTDLNFTTDLNRTEYSTDEMLNGTMPLIIGGNFNTIDIGINSEIKKKLVYEFDFWFTRNIGNSIPIKNLRDIVKLVFHTEKKII